MDRLIMAWPMIVSNSETNEGKLETNQMSQKHDAANILGMYSGSLFSLWSLISQSKDFEKLMKGLQEITERKLSTLMSIR